MRSVYFIVMLLQAVACDSWLNASTQQQGANGSMTGSLHVVLAEDEKTIGIVDFSASTGAGNLQIFASDSSSSTPLASATVPAQHFALSIANDTFYSAGDTYVSSNIFVFSLQNNPPAPPVISTVSSTPYPSFITFAGAAVHGMAHIRNSNYLVFGGDTRLVKYDTLARTYVGKGVSMQGTSTVDAVEYSEGTHTVQAVYVANTFCVLMATGMQLVWDLFNSTKNSISFYHLRVDNLNDNNYSYVVASSGSMTLIEQIDVRNSIGRLTPRVTGDITSYGVSSSLWNMNSFQYISFTFPSAPAVLGGAAGVMSKITGQVLTYRTSVWTFAGTGAFAYAKICRMTSFVTSDNRWLMLLADAASTSVMRFATQLDTCLNRLPDGTCTSCRSGFFFFASNASCLAPQDTPAGYGPVQVNSTLIRCADAACLTCAQDFQVCTMCNASQPVLLRNGKCNNIPIFYGLNTPTTIARCNINNCMQCFFNYTTCTKCSPGLVALANNTCYDISSCPAGYGYNALQGSIVTCSDTNCRTCSSNYSNCTACAASYVLAASTCYAASASLAVAATSFNMSTYEMLITFNTPIKLHMLQLLITDDVRGETFTCDTPGVACAASVYNDRCLRVEVTGAVVIGGRVEVTNTSVISDLNDHMFVSYPISIAPFLSYPPLLNLPHICATIVSFILTFSFLFNITGAFHSFLSSSYADYLLSSALLLHLLLPSQHLFFFHALILQPSLLHFLAQLLLLILIFHIISIFLPTPQHTVQPHSPSAVHYKMFFNRSYLTVTLIGIMSSSTSSILERATAVGGMSYITFITVLHMRYMYITYKHKHVQQDDTKLRDVYMIASMRYKCYSSLNNNILMLEAVHDVIDVCMCVCACTSASPPAVSCTLLFMHVVSLFMLMSLKNFFIHTFHYFYLLLSKLIFILFFLQHLMSLALYSSINTNQSVHAFVLSIIALLLILTPALQACYVFLTTISHLVQRIMRRNITTPQAATNGVVLKSSISNK